MTSPPTDPALDRVVGTVLRHPRAWMIPVALAAQALGIWLMVNKIHPLLVAAVAVGIAIAPIALGSASRVLGLLVFLLMASHTEGASLASPMVYQPLMVVPFVGWAGFLLVREWLDGGRVRFGFHGFGAVWIALGLWALVGALWGRWRGTNEIVWTIEVMLALFYGTFFLAAAGLRRPGDYRALAIAFGLGMLAISLDYVISAVGGASGDARWGRILSRQANLAAAAAPFVVAGVLVFRRRSWLWAAGLGPLVVVVVLSQQRALFIAFPLSILVAVALAFRTRGASRRRVVGLAAGLALAGALAWGASGQLTTVRGGPSVQEGLTERLGETETGGGAPALVIRLLSYAYIWEHRIQERPFLGWGLGDTAFIPVLRGSNFEMMRVDNSFVTLWWKTGIVGLVLFLTLWGWALVKAFRLLRHPHREVQFLALGAIGAMVAMLVLSMASSLVTHYRFNAMWGVLMGALAVADRVYPVHHRREDA